MHIVLIEPSPLARNVYRLILRRMPGWKISEATDLHAMDRLPTTKQHIDLVLIGEGAFEEHGIKLRTMLTDVALWQRLPKLIVTFQRATDRKSAWDGLSQLVVLARPFPPAAFTQAVKAAVKCK